MKTDKLNSTLAAIAEKAIPTSEIDLWPDIRQRLETSTWHSQTGETMKPFAQNIPVRRLTLAVLTIVAGFVLLAFTPQGQALAQKLFRFFTVAENRSFPLPTEQMMPILVTETPAAPYLLPLQTAEAPLEPTPIPASTQPCASSASGSDYFCQFEVVEGQANFDAKEFPADPQGMRFSQVSFEAERRLIDTEFVAIGDGGYLTLLQGQGDFPPDGNWAKAPADAITVVTINGHYGELMHGGFVVYPGATEAVWNPEVPTWILRWRDDNFWYSLTKAGDPGPIEWLNSAELVKLAENLVDRRPAEAQPISTDGLSLEAAEKQVGLKALIPGHMLQGFEFRRADAMWNNTTIRLFYAPDPSTNINAGLYIFQTTLSAAPGSAGCPECPASSVEKVQVGSWAGYYWRGVFEVAPIPTDGSPTPVPQWKPDARQWTVTWKTEKALILMLYYAADSFGGEPDKATLLDIAESLK